MEQIKIDRLEGGCREKKEISTVKLFEAVPIVCYVGRPNSACGRSRHTIEMYAIAANSSIYVVTY